jgi:hypothetical protein
VVGAAVVVAVSLCSINRKLWDGLGGPRGSGGKEGGRVAWEFLSWWERGVLKGAWDVCEVCRAAGFRGYGGGSPKSVAMRLHLETGWACRKFHC